MILFPKSIVYFFKNGYFTCLQNLVPSLQRIKIQHGGQCGISGFSQSVDLAASTNTFHAFMQIIFMPIMDLSGTNRILSNSGTLY